MSNDAQEEGRERWVRIDDVAEHLGVPVSTARRLERLYCLPRRKWGHRTIRYRLSEIDEVLEGLTLDP